MNAITHNDDRLAVFAPPYESYRAVDLSWVPSSLPPRGLALIWWLVDGRVQEREFEWLHYRPPGLPLIVILPPAREIISALPLLNYVSALEPKAVLPSARLNSPARLRQLLAAPPTALSAAVVSHFISRNLLPNRTVSQEVQKVIDAAPEVSSISKLARRLYTSRRTLGRHFAAAGLPVPSHWLQFARLLHVSIRLQNESAAVFRIASRAGYPDGFTLSNQMKRLVGCRPSEIRQFLGWEWVVESWICHEARRGAFDLARFGNSLEIYLYSAGQAEGLTNRLTAAGA